MAESDNFNDLYEIGIDSQFNNSLTETFNKAANHLQTLLPNIDNDKLLLLYGYYKQGLDGKCDIPKPRWYDIKAKSKWEAWNKLGDMSQNEAKTLYIETIKNLDPDFDMKDNKWVTVSVPQIPIINDSDKTIIDYITEGNYEKVKNILLNDNNKNINEIDNNGLGLIHWAADRGSINILELLISLGANVNLKDSDGQTALHYASSCGHIDCIKLLLSSKAEKNALDNNGQTSCSVACDDTVKELLNNYLQ